MNDLAANPGDGVVLLHGILLNRWFMIRLEHRFKDLGYRTLNPSYPSSRYRIEELAERLHPRIDRFAQRLKGRLHFVTHSMGGLITRVLLKTRRPPNLGRVCMLGPPNHGSEVADWWKHRWLYRVLFGPAGQQLGTDQQGLAEFPGPVDYELGVIAADRTWDVFNARFLPRPHDGKVSVASTRLEGMQDHITLHATHTFMVFNPEVIRQAAYFLKHGRFDAAGRPAD